MAVIITSWAFDAWSTLQAEGQFTEEHYRDILRPSALLLHRYPDDPRSQQSKFGVPPKIARETKFRGASR